jgi:hypothetical protein
MAEYIEREKAIDACFDGWNNNAHDCAENIRSIPAADVRPVGWIPVTERLPEIGETVLVWYLWQDEQRHSIAFDEMIINSVTMKPKWNRHHLQNHVTHWMPLPEPPKEEAT